MGIRLSNSGRNGLVSPARTARKRNGSAAYLSWIGPCLIAVIVTGWMFVRAEAANPPPDQSTHSAVSAPALLAPAPDAPRTAPAISAPNAPVSNGDASGIHESNIAPAEKSGDEEGVSNSPVRGAHAVASVDGLTLLRQSLRRGGLGSKALMTLTIRNANDYPVKHIQLLCSFRSRDGHYVTNRRRTIDGVVRPNSRRTFRHMMIGFVSVNANRATCSLVSADWA